MLVSYHVRVGERIRELRKRSGIPQNVLAKAVGISPGALTNFEKGRRRISLDWLQKIADVLDTPVAYFLEEETRESAGHPKERRLLAAWRKLTPVLQRDFLHLIITLSKQWRRRAPTRPRRLE